jgi:hypothetical protein
LAGLSRLWLTVDKTGLVVVGVRVRGDRSAWQAEDIAAVLLGLWVGDLIEGNPALETYLQGMLGYEDIPVATEAVVRALMTTAQAEAHG